MKLALTMSKDEIFQRSKNIMRNQTANMDNGKAIASNNKSSKSSRDSDTEHSSSSRISSVLRATKKSFSKWSSRSGNGYTVSSKMDKQGPQNVQNTKAKISTIQIPTLATLPTLPTLPTLSIPKTPMPQRMSSNNSVKPSPEYACPECSYDSESCSHKCYCSMSDYQSQNDFSDGEQCYCSLQRVKPGGTPVYRIRLDTDTDTSQGSSLNQIKTAYNKPSKNRQNYARKTASLTSWSALSGAESPMTAWRRNTANLQHLHQTTGPSSSSRLTQANASFMRRKSLSSYLSDTSLDSDVVAMTEPAHKFTSNGKSSFAKQPEILRRKSRSSYLSSETELESVTTSSSSFVRAPMLPLGRKPSPPASAGYQSYDSIGTASSGKTSRNYSHENLAPVKARRNSNSSSDNSVKGNKKVITFNPLKLISVHNVLCCSND